MYSYTENETTGRQSGFLEPTNLIHCLEICLVSAAFLSLIGWCENRRKSKRTPTHPSPWKMWQKQFTLKYWLVLNLKINGCCVCSVGFIIVFKYGCMWVKQNKAYMYSIITRFVGSFMYAMEWLYGRTTHIQCSSPQPYVSLWKTKFALNYFVAFLLVCIGISFLRHPFL